MSENLQQDSIQVFLPKLGESITSATVVKWLKKKGDPVSLDEPLLEVSTDKVNSEIPSPINGFLEEIYANEDQEKEVGELLCCISSKMKKIQALEEKEQRTSTEDNSKESLFLSPAVLRLMQEFQISLDTLKKIVPSGQNGRITKLDVESFLEGKKGLPVQLKECPMAKQPASEEFEKVKMTKLRSMIAENMTKSFYTAPHATLVHEIDFTKISQFIKKEKEKILKQNGIKLSVTAFIAYAISKAIESFPMINSSLEDDYIIVKKQVNLGIAVSVDEAVLVPVIKNAHLQSVLELAKEIQELAFKAKTQKLDPQDVKQGTITMTNFGMSGTLIGVPIIRYKEVAIIGIGALSKKVVVCENDTFGIREMAYLSLSFDHRVLDGMYGCAFLASIKNTLEKTNWEEICTN